MHADNRGRFVGARGDYARTDDEMRAVREITRAALREGDLPEPMSAADARHPWRWEPGWMHAAWLRGVRDLLDWVLGESAAGPLCGRPVDLPSTSDLHYEADAANVVVMQGRPGGVPVDPGQYPPPQYGEGIQAAIRWLRGETGAAPVDPGGRGPYLYSSDRR